MFVKNYKYIGLEAHNMEAKYSASLIAKWFLYYNYKLIEDEDADYISNLKLQKLLYYAQGSYLALTGKRLFKEDLYAWEHGPVVPEVYREYKINGSRGIEYTKGDYDGSVTEEDESILKQVYEIFGAYSAWGLRDKTHNEAPWKETDINKVIDTELIKNYFLENYVNEEA